MDARERKSPPSERETSGVALAALPGGRSSRALGVVRRGRRHPRLRPRWPAEREIPLHSRRIVLGGELAPGRLIAASGDEGPERWRTFVVDVDGGTVRPVGDGLVPTALLGASYAPNAFPEAGSEATRLFLREGRELVSLDPGTGRLRVVLRGRASKP
jgi:hypothetical protein